MTAGLDQFEDSAARRCCSPRMVDAGEFALAHDMYLAGPPVPLQRAAFRLLANTNRPLARPAT